MTYFNITTMTREKRDLLLEWVEAEGLDPKEISGTEKFSVHNGRVAGHKLVWGTIDDSTPLVNRRKKVVVTVPFNVPQVNPLPEELT